MTKEISKWADDAMFEAQEIDASKGPEVYLLSCNNDPLGSIVAAAHAYKGIFHASLAEITDDERRHYLAEVQKTVLEMPLEAVNFHFRISGVTRGFTHQLVRQRTAAYSQESTRFAVKERVPVGLPPSLKDTDTDEWKHNFQEYKEMLGSTGQFSLADARAYAAKYTSQKNRWRHKWDELMAEIEVVYNELVNDGMPAEDARGALPTNLLTQVNYFTNLRGLKGHSGLRLCTQAQYEWKEVWAQIIGAIREYGETQYYTVSETELSSKWQFDALADIFRPDCYYAGKCTFKADFDRKCSIRDRVDANAEINRPSTEWHLQEWVDESGRRGQPTGDGLTGEIMLGIPAILPQEWLLDPSAAR